MYKQNLPFTLNITFNKKIFFKTLPFTGLTGSFVRFKEIVKLQMKPFFIKFIFQCHYFQFLCHNCEWNDKWKFGDNKIVLNGIMKKIIILWILKSHFRWIMTKIVIMPTAICFSQTLCNISQLKICWQFFSWWCKLKEKDF